MTTNTPTDQPTQNTRSSTMTNDQTPEQIDPIVSVDDGTEMTNTETVDAEQQEDQQSEGKAGREAARYRRQLRDAEAERDQLRTQLDAAREHIVTAAIDRHGVTTAAITAAGHDLGSMFGDDGTLNRDALDAAAAETAEKFGIRPTPALYLPGEGKYPEDRYPKVDFTAAFSPDKQ